MDDLSALPPAAREAAVVARAREEAGAPFDLAVGPLLRAALLRLGPAAHVLLLTLHHIVADGWSMDVLLRELSGAYGAISRGGRPPCRRCRCSTGTTPPGSGGGCGGSALEGQLAYWRAALAGLPEALDLPTDHPYPAQQTFDGGRESIDLPADLMARLMAAGRREGATLYMVLLAAFQALLGRYSGQTDLAVGTPVAGRPRPELEGLIGFFVNTLVLRADLSGNPTVREHLARVRETCLGAQAHQDVPFERLVDELRPQRDLSRNPLFQAMFVYEPAPAQPLSFPGLEAQALDPPAGVARFDLTLVVTERAGPERRSRGGRRAGRRARCLAGQPGVPQRPLRGPHRAAHAGAPDDPPARVRQHSGAGAWTTSPCCLPPSAGSSWWTGTPPHSPTPTTSPSTISSPATRPRPPTPSRRCSRARA